MGSLRHNREHDFDLRGDPDSIPAGKPNEPRDSAEDTATDYGEKAAWPDAERPEGVS